MKRLVNLANYNITYIRHIYTISTVFLLIGFLSCRPQYLSCPKKKRCVTVPAYFPSNDKLALVSEFYFEAHVSELSEKKKSQHNKFLKIN